MLILVVTVVLGIIFALFATQNTGFVSIYLGKYMLEHVPVYLVVLLPLFLGLFASLIIYVVKNLSTSLTLSEQKDEVKKLKKELAEVTKKAHKLELENTKLKVETGEFDEDSLQQT